jgi:ribosomal protein S18 acetylase RimI-like enzyme
MPPFAAPRVEALAGHHDRAGFDSGEAALDDYLRRRAGQDVKRNIARVFVAVAADGAGILGYYSLSAASFQKSELPPDLAKRLPHYPVPAAILGRLAVDRAQRGRRIGKFLLFDALGRVLAASAQMAVYAVVVDAKNDGAKAFYEHFGFRAFAESPNRLILPLQTIAAAAGPQGLRLPGKP